MERIEKEFVNSLMGSRLEAVFCAANMLCFEFDNSLIIHANGFCRVIKNGDLLITTYDYQSWDGEDSTHNDEWVNAEHFKPEIIGGLVNCIELSTINDLKLMLSNGVIIECLIQSAYPHYEEETEQETEQEEVVAEVVTSNNYTTRMTSFYPAESTNCTGSGLCTWDFDTNENGYYTYNGKIVVATATKMLEREGFVLYDGVHTFNYYDELQVNINGVQYSAIVLDSCGNCMKTDRIDLFVNGAESVIDTTVDISY